MATLSIAPSKDASGHGSGRQKSPTLNSACKPSLASRSLACLMPLGDPSIPETLNPSRAIYQEHAPGPHPTSSRRTAERSGTRYQLRATNRITCSGGYLPHSRSEKICSQDWSNMMLASIPKWQPRPLENIQQTREQRLTVEEGGATRAIKYT